MAAKQTQNNPQRKPLSPEDLRELLNYCPRTGRLIWRKRTDSQMPDLRVRNSFNSQFAGKKAGGKFLKYLAVQIEGKSYLCHRVVWAIYYGRWPKDEIDHINHEGTDNRICNLRECSRLQNNRNASLRKDSPYSIPGVYRIRRGWQALIRVNGKIVYLGTHNNFFDACCARKSAENKYGYHSNHGK